MYASRGHCLSFAFKKERDIRGTKVHRTKEDFERDSIYGYPEFNKALKEKENNEIVMAQKYGK